jgi:hypothetical protein
MKKIIRTERAHSIPPFYMATTFTVTLDLDMVPGAMHDIEYAANAILSDCSYLLAAIVDTSVKPGSQNVQIEVLGAMDAVPGSFHEPVHHEASIREGSCRSYIKDVTYDPDLKHAYVLRGKFNEMCETGDLFSMDEVTG